MKVEGGKDKNGRNRLQVIIHSLPAAIALVDGVRYGGEILIDADLNG